MGLPVALETDVEEAEAAVGGKPTDVVKRGLEMAEDPFRWLQGGQGVEHEVLMPHHLLEGDQPIPKRAPNDRVAFHRRPAGSREVTTGWRMHGKGHGGNGMPGEYGTDAGDVIEMRHGDTKEWSRPFSHGALKEEVGKTKHSAVLLREDDSQHKCDPLVGESVAYGEAERRSAVAPDVWDRRRVLEGLCGASKERGEGHD